MYSHRVFTPCIHTLCSHLQAADEAGCRVLVQSNWSRITVGGHPRCFDVGPCPHDWLLPQVAAVVHHGGAGTTAAGLRYGKPTLVCPFFGDQFMWGEMVRRAGAGPPPCPIGKLTVESLAARFRELRSDSMVPLTPPRALLAVTWRDVTVSCRGASSDVVTGEPGGRAGGGDGDGGWRDARLRALPVAGGSILGKGGLCIHISAFTPLRSHFLSQLPRDAMLCDASLLQHRLRLLRPPPPIASFALPGGSWTRASIFGRCDASLLLEPPERRLATFDLCPVAGILFQAASVLLALAGGCIFGWWLNPSTSHYCDLIFNDNFNTSMENWREECMQDVEVAKFANAGTAVVSLLLGLGAAAVSGYVAQVCQSVPAHPRAHTACPRSLFTPPVHTSCSHLLFTLPVHTSCSQLIRRELWPDATLLKVSSEVMAMCIVGDVDAVDAGNSPPGSAGGKSVPPTPGRPGSAGGIGPDSGPSGGGGGGGCCALCHGGANRDVHRMPRRGGGRFMRIQLAVLLRSGYYSLPHATRLWDTSRVTGLRAGCVAGLVGFLGEIVWGVLSLFIIPDRWARSFGLAGSLLGLLYAPLALAVLRPVQAAPIQHQQHLLTPGLTPLRSHLSVHTCRRR